MVRFSPNLKKALLIGTVILLGCDVSMLFAQPASQGASSQQTDPRLQQLQSQVQAQIQALQNQSAGATQTPANTLSPSQQTAVQQAASQQLGAEFGNNGSATAVAVPTNQKTDNILPPSPFNPPQVASSSGAGSPQQIPPPPIAGLQNVQQQKLTTQTTTAAVPTPDTVPPTPFNEQIQLPSAAQAVSVQNTAAGSAAVASAMVGAPASAPGTPPPLDVSDSEVSDAAFTAMVKNALPLSPDQIQKLRSVYMASQFAAQNSPVAPPRPTATSQFVDLSPGATPPVIRLAQGFVTSLVFVDSTGAPWDIESYDVGNPSAFNIQWDKSSNTMMVQSTALYTYGNLAVKLRNLNTPVMLTLIPGQKAVDYRVDLRIQGLGPEAKPLTMSTLPASTSSDLLNVLDGVPPSNSQALTVEGGDCQAWLSGNTMYVRTRLNILSPGWVATLSSADGMHAYEMQPTPMLLVSQNGEVLQLKVEGF